jgi:hypothetical protein
VCGCAAADPRQVKPLNQQTRPLKADDDFKTLLAPPPKPKSYKWGWAAVAVLAVVAVSLAATSIVLFVVWPPWGEQTEDTTERRVEKNKPTPHPTRSAPARMSLPEPTYSATPYPTYEPTPELLPKPPAHDIVRQQMFVEPLHFRYIPFTVESVGYQGLVVGRFDAWGGNNDINFVILPAHEMSSFQNHGAYTHFYNSGYIHGANVKRALPPGDYFLIFNNRSALLTGKTVNAFFELRYE